MFAGLTARLAARLPSTGVHGVRATYWGSLAWQLKPWAIPRTPASF
jgi:hypothetical protein